MTGNYPSDEPCNKYWQSNAPSTCAACVGTCGEYTCAEQIETVLVSVDVVGTPVECCWSGGRLTQWMTYSREAEAEQGATPCLWTANVGDLNNYICSYDIMRDQQCDQQIAYGGGLYQIQTTIGFNCSGSPYHRHAIINSNTYVDTDDCCGWYYMYTIGTDCAECGDDPYLEVSFMPVCGNLNINTDVLQEMRSILKEAKEILPKDISIGVSYSGSKYDVHFIEDNNTLKLTKK